MLAIIIKWLRQYFVSSLVLPCWTLYSKHFTKYQTGLCYLRKRFRSFHGTLENLTAAKNITIPASLISMPTRVGLGALAHCLSSPRSGGPAACLRALGLRGVKAWEKSMKGGGADMAPTNDSGFLWVCSSRDLCWVLIHLYMRPSEVPSSWHLGIMKC